MLLDTPAHSADWPVCPALAIKWTVRAALVGPMDFALFLVE